MQGKIYYIFFSSIILLGLYGCDSANKTEVPQGNKTKAAAEPIAYPEPITKILNSHGGLDLWKKQNSLRYDMVKDTSLEKYWVDLFDRRERIESPNFTMGYNGKDYWIDADTSVKMNPVFYKNLIFYFYAMPFVLADEGIHYEAADTLNYDGVSYPGYRISYGEGIGVSPKDEYFLYYDKDSYEMAWLGYTVTFGKNEASQRIGWIRYDDWAKVSGLFLPKSLSWYTTEDNLPVTFRNKRNFQNISLSTEPMDSTRFEMTENAIIKKAKS